MFVLALVAVTGLLVHFVVVGTMSNGFYLLCSSVFSAHHANVVPVAIAKSVKILRSDREYSGKVVIANVLSISGVNRGQAADCDGNPAESPCFTAGIILNLLHHLRPVSWSTGRDDALEIMRIVFKGLVPFFGVYELKPPFSFFPSLWSEEGYRKINLFECGRLPKIGEVEICPQLFSRFDMDTLRNLSRPDVWPLVDLKLLTVVVDAFAGQHRLPPSQGSLPVANSGIEKDSRKRKPFQPHFYSFTSRIYLTVGCVCGSILFAFGVVSLFFIWRKIGMYSAAHMNVMLAFGLLLSAGFIWWGQWVLFSVFGLMP